jgi:hypothetical protein
VRKLLVLSSLVEETMRKLIPYVTCFAATLTVPAAAQNFGNDWDHSEIKHVLLISVDGMHAVDYLNCMNGVSSVNNGAPYCPNLAALGTTGVNYVGASTSKPSDSFPGLMTIMSGATPRLMGIYYDVAYDRSLDGPSAATAYGNGPGPCTAGTTPTGFTTEYDEGIDLNYMALNGGAPNASLIDGGVASIDSTKLDRDPANGCAPVYPWNFVRTNTIYGVIHSAGGYTAWSDKHPSYSSVAGRDGIGSLDDYYSPEINSNVIALPNVTTADGVSCSSIPDGSADLTAWTNSFANIKCYDTLKVNAVLNWIAGKNHLGTANAKTPTVYGMNFQAVSVGEKLIESSTKGGYLDASATPTASLLSEIQFVDDSIGQMVNAIKDRGQYESTLIIITAKHGQSPIDPNLYQAVPGKNSNGLSPATLIENKLAAAMPPTENPEGSGVGSTEDDVSLLWLTNPSYTGQAVALIEENKSTVMLGQLYYGASLALNYDWPGLGTGLDPRTPDIIVTPNVGVTYTGSATKLMEHGGFAHDDTNVILLLSNPAFRPRTVFTGVGTNQVAPTVVKALGLNPSALDSVRIEGTAVLPDVNLNFGH